MSDYEDGYKAGYRTGLRQIGEMEQYKEAYFALLKSVADATAFQIPAPSFMLQIPDNCGTGHCSCIECFKEKPNERSI